MIEPFLPVASVGPTRTSAARRWGTAAAIVMLCTALSELISPRLDLANVIMVYFAGVVYVALYGGLAPSVATVVVSIFLFDLIFVPPRWGLNPLNPSHFLTFGVMLAVGLLISRLAEQARQQSQRSAHALLEAQAERLRNTLLSGISHDFRTPLTTIIGAATSLLQQDDRLVPAQRRLLLHSVQEEAQRLHRLVSDLLELTRLEEGAVQPACEWCPADELVEEALAALARRKPSHPVVADVPSGALVWCDPRLVGLALNNLLDNAWRHTPAGTPIRVVCTRQSHAWHLCVQDEGPGLPPGPPQLLFQKFHHGPQAAGGGTGLGLAICAAVARLHQGVAEAEPGPEGRGARFSLVLPQPAAADVPLLESLP